MFSLRNFPDVALSSSLELITAERYMAFHPFAPFNRQRWPAVIILGCRLADWRATGSGSRPSPSPSHVNIGKLASSVLT